MMCRQTGYRDDDAPEFDAHAEMMNERAAEPRAIVIERERCGLFLSAADVEAIRALVWGT